MRAQVTVRVNLPRDVTPWCTDVELQTFFQLWIADVVRARIRKLADKANSVLSKTLGKWGADQESQLLSVPPERSS